MLCHRDIYSLSIIERAHGFVTPGKHASQLSFGCFDSAWTAAILTWFAGKPCLHTAQVYPIAFVRLAMPAAPPPPLSAAAAFAALSARARAALFALQPPIPIARGELLDTGALSQ